MSLDAKHRQARRERLRILARSEYWPDLVEELRWKASDILSGMHDMTTERVWKAQGQLELARWLVSFGERVSEESQKK